MTRWGKWAASAAVVLIAAAIVGGRYQASGAMGGVVRVDRLTGEAVYCEHAHCWTLPTERRSEWMVDPVVDVGSADAVAIEAADEASEAAAQAR